MPSLMTFAWRVVALPALCVLAAEADAQDLSDKRLFPENIVLGANTEGRPYVYGQINKGLLIHADGADTKVYPLVDNSNSSTRAGIKYQDTWWSSLTVFANVEAEWKPYASSSVNQLNQGDVDLDASGLRKLEVSFEAHFMGRFWIGQGSTASDGTAEKDLSGTGVIAYSSISDTAGGQLFVIDGADLLSDVSVGSAFSNLDGLGWSAPTEVVHPLG